VSDELSHLGQRGPPPGSPLDPSGPRRRRPLFWLALAFCAGIFFDEWLAPSLPALGGAVLASALLVLAALVLFPKSALRQRAGFCAALMVGICGGALRNAQEARYLNPAHVAVRTPETPVLVWLEGTVLEVRGRSAERATWTFETSALGSSPEDLSPAAGRVQLHLRTEPDAEAVEFREGARLRLLARLEAPAQATLPEGFDAANYLYHEGIRRVGVCANSKVEVLGRAPWYRVGLHLRAFSGYLADRNRANLDPDRAALLNALFLGRTDTLERSDREAFAQVGTAHLLAIAGLHLHAIAALLWWVFARLGLPRRRVAWFLIAFVLGYTAFCGGAPPVVRAAVLISTYLVGFLLFRAPDPLTTLAVAALALLFYAPQDLFTMSFQLSFLAVLALVVLVPTLESAWLAWRKIPEAWILDPEEMRVLWWKRKLRSGVFVSLAAWIGTAPVVAWHLGNFSWLTLFTNLIAVPWTLFSMLLGGLAMIFCSAWADVAFGWPLSLLLGFHRALSALPSVSMEVPVPPMLLCVAYAALCAWTWWSRGRTASLPRLALVLPALLFSLLLGGLFRAPLSGPRITVFDLPRGRSALVETPGGGACLVDCGSDTEGRNLADALRRQGVHEISLLVVTEDLPEAVGGLESLLNKFRVRRAILPRANAPSMRMRSARELLEARGTALSDPDFTGALRGPGDLRWEFASDAPESGPPNSGSEALSVRVAYPGATALFVTARSEAGVQRLQKQYAELLKADVVRLSPGPYGHWPQGLGPLLRESGVRTLIAGEGMALPDEGSGFDLATFASEHGLRLFAPHRDGSLRFTSDALSVQMFKQGRWRESDGP